MRLCKFLQKRPYALLFVGLVLGALMFMAQGSKAEALYYNSNLPFSNVPYGIKYPWGGPRPDLPHDGRCTPVVGTNYTAGQFTWLVQQNGNDFTGTTADVQYGQSYADLYLVVANAICAAGGPVATYNHYYNITAVLGGSTNVAVSGSGAGNDIIINTGYPPLSNADTHVGVAAAPFRVALPTNLSPGLHTVTVTVHGGNRINKSSSGSLGCVRSGTPAPPKDEDQAATYSGCFTEDYAMNITINVIQPKVGIGGRVYSTDTNGANIQGVAGMTITLCNGQTTTTNSDGYWLALVDKWSNFCVRRSGALPTTWTEGPVTNNNVNGVPGGSNRASYEWQVAGINCYNDGFCGDNGIGGNDEVLTYDLNSANEAIYDFAYVRHLPTCSALTSSPTNPEAGQPIVVSFGVNFLPRAGNQPFDYFIQATVPGITGTQTTLNVSPVQYTIPGLASPGSYVVTWKVLGSWGSINCTGRVVVAGKPYVKAFGNDIAAGGKFADVSATTCSANPTKANAGVWAFKKTTDNVFYSGASGQFGVVALGKIIDTASASNRGSGSIADPNPTLGLSFGNMVAGGGAFVADNAGGNSGIYRCIPDYYKAATNPLPSGSTVSDTVIPAGTHKAVFVNGDAYITNDITFDTSSPWATPNDIPSYYLIAKGNIYIAPGVKNLDGVYIAQPINSSTGGNIYTCANGPTLFTSAQIYAACQNKLTITGSFIAARVRYQRTLGTLEKSDAGGKVNESPSSNNIAEVFNFSQEMYLAPTPSVLDSIIAGSSKNRYDAITSLPPIL